MLSCTKPDKVRSRNPDSLHIRTRLKNKANDCRDRLLRNSYHDLRRHKSSYYAGRGELADSGPTFLASLVRHMSLCPQVLELGPFRAFFCARILMPKRIFVLSA